MRRLTRMLIDRVFTSLAGLSVVLMAAALAIILGPILYRGGKAMVFRGTVEFHRMILGEFGRGDPCEIQQELDRCAPARQAVYRVLDAYASQLGAGEQLDEQAKDVYDDFKDYLAARRGEPNAPSRQEVLALRQRVRETRDSLRDAYHAHDEQAALKQLDRSRKLLADPNLAGTPAQRYAKMIADYRGLIQAGELRRQSDFQTVQKLIRELLGPRPGKDGGVIAEVRYGATRWDRAQRLLEEIRYRVTWEQPDPNRTDLPLVRRAEPRSQLYAGTALAELFPLLEDRLGEMLAPHWMVYWHYLTDNATPGNLFGGVGRELLGTLLLAFWAMIFAVPLGVIAAAYLVECTRDGVGTRVLRTCINTLAGVPSVVFGLFGLAFFVGWFQPHVLGWESQPSVLAGALTLAALVLPIVIRASEEAIRSVPQTYKEASLALGAGSLRTFLTVTLPAAGPGVLTGIILSLSRAAGETAPILFTAAVTLGGVHHDSAGGLLKGFFGGDLGQRVQALPYSGYMFATNDDLALQAPHNLYGMIAVLILLVLLLNAAAIVLRSRMSRKLRGS